MGLAAPRRILHGLDADPERALGTGLDRRGGAVPARRRRLPARPTARRRRHRGQRLRDRLRPGRPPVRPGAPRCHRAHRRHVEASGRPARRWWARVAAVGALAGVEPADRDGPLARGRARGVVTLTLAVTAWRAERLRGAAREIGLGALALLPQLAWI